MIVPDINLIVYAHDRTAPSHTAARQWWEQTVSGPVPIGVPWVVVLAFVRLMTHPTLSENPMTVRQVREATSAWLDRPSVRLLSPSPRTYELMFELLEQAGSGGNLSTDAMIAALALEHGGEVFSNDRDFDRFPGLIRRNPLG
jgi:uncharacterized protein